MSGQRIHFDEARAAAMAIIRRFTDQRTIERAVLVADIFGGLRLAIWPKRTPLKRELQTLNKALRTDCGGFWSGEIWTAGRSGRAADEEMLFESAWNEGFPVDSSKFRINDRHRNHSAWFARLDRKHSPIWPETKGPPVLVFHSYKGGVGRTTALAAFALSRARHGDRVAVIDMDLDAPGVGSLLDADGKGTTAQWGVVDALLEAEWTLPLSDYLHVCARAPLTGKGSIEVFPAGRLDDNYLTKLSRIDLELSDEPRRHPLISLIWRISRERRPDLILVDGRAGLSAAAGLLLSGFAHLHVLFATINRQSLMGLNRVIHRLGFDRVRSGLPQLDCVLVQAMLPDNTTVAEVAEAEFAAQTENLFRYEYYAEEPDAEDRLWSLRDLESSIAPHRPITLRYRGSLAFFQSIDQIADELTDSKDYRTLCSRLTERLAPSFSRGR
jgi:CobQ/CobB/MinD/ParA family nucleotide binding protein